MLEAGLLGKGICQVLLSSRRTQTAGGIGKDEATQVSKGPPPISVATSPDCPQLGTWDR